VRNDGRAVRKPDADVDVRFGAGCQLDRGGPVVAGSVAYTEDFHPKTQKANGRYSLANGFGNTMVRLAHDRRGENAAGINSAVYLPPTNLGQEPDTLTSIPNPGVRTGRRTRRR